MTGAFDEKGCFMKSVWKFGVGAVALSALAGCVPGNSGPSGPFDGPGGDMHRPPGQESFSQVLLMRTEQGCDAAVPPLRRFSSYGGGFEIAQFELGDCLVEEARKAGSDAERQRMATEAEAILLKAANSNEPNAQGLLTALYFRGDLLERDVVAAGKWFLLYSRNNLRINLGARDLPKGLETDMRNTLTEDQWKAATDAADAFEVTIQPTSAPPEREGPDGERRGPPSRDPQ
jgi:hypothetical protein